MQVVMHRRRLPLLAAAAAVSLACAAPAAAQTTDTAIAPAPASPARDFHDSIGMNVHVSYFSTAYGNFTKVRERLNELGVKHLRDGACATCTLQQDRQRLLADDGMKFTFIMANPGSNVGSLGDLVSTVETRFPDAVAGLESVNEPDMLGLLDWVSLTRTHQQDVAARVAASPVLRGTPVLAPAVVKAVNRTLLGDLTGSADLANLHPYPGGRPAAENLPSALADAAVNVPGKPAWATENGYHNALATTAGHKPTSEKAAARYIPELFLESFRLGVPRTFLYELVDERPEPTLTDPEQAFGLLRNDFSAKPAFDSLRNTIDLVEGANAGTGSLRIKVDGASSGVRALLLRKTDKQYVVALWPTSPIWDPVARKELVPPTKALNVRFGEKVASVAVHRPVAGAAPVHTVANPASVPVTLTDEPVLLDVTLP